MDKRILTVILSILAVILDAMKEDESCVESFCDLLNEMLFHWGISSV